MSDDTRLVFDELSGSLRNPAKAFAAVFLAQMELGDTGSYAVTSFLGDPRADAIAAALEKVGAGFVLDVLGHGSFGVAGALQQNRVVKVTTDPAEVKAGAVLVGKTLPHVVPVHGAWFIQGVTVQGVIGWDEQHEEEIRGTVKVGILIEDKLRMLGQVYPDMAKQLDDVVRRVKARHKFTEITHLKSVAKKRAALLALSEELTQELSYVGLDEVASGLEELRDHGIYAADVHRGNVGVDQDDVIRIFDVGVGSPPSEGPKPKVIAKAKAKGLAMEGAVVGAPRRRAAVARESPTDWRTFVPDHEYVDRVAVPQMPDIVERAIAAGAAPPLAYMGVGMTSVVLCSGRRAFKVGRDLRPVTHSWLEDEADFMAACAKVRGVREHVARFERFDAERLVIVRACPVADDDARGRIREDDLWNLHREIERLMLPHGWTSPEFKPDSYVKTAKGAILVDGTSARRVGKVLLTWVGDVLDGRRTAWNDRPEDIAFALRMEVGKTLTAEQIAPLEARLASMPEREWGKPWSGAAEAQERRPDVGKMFDAAGDYGLDGRNLTHLGRTVGVFDLGANAEDGVVVEVNKLEILPALRGRGYARGAMAQLVAIADANGWTLALSPTSEWGSSKSRLAAFYKSLGFVPNRGKGRDFRFRDAMYRAPSAAEETRSVAASRAWDRRREQDERVEQNLPPDQIALWRKMKTHFKGTPHQRFEAFTRYVEEHPDEVVSALVQDEPDYGELQRAAGYEARAGEPRETFKQMQARLKSERASRLEQVRRAWAESPAAVVRHKRGDEMVLLSPEPSNPEEGPMRLTYLMPEGPRGHDVGTRESLAETLADSGFLGITPASDADVMAWTSSPAYELGAKAVAFTQADNEIRFLAARIGRREDADAVLRVARPMFDRDPDGAIEMVQAKLAEMHSAHGASEPRAEEVGPRPRTGPRFFHGSSAKHPVGFVLHGRFKKDRHPPDEMDRLRPSSLPFERAEALFMVQDPSRVDAAGGLDRYLYEVEPLGRVFGPYDGGWFSKAAWARADRRPKEVDKAILSYWSGKPCGEDQDCSGAWEWLTAEARIVRVVRADGKQAAAEPRDNSCFPPGLQDARERGRMGGMAKPKDGSWVVVAWPDESFEVNSDRGRDLGYAPKLRRFAIGKSAMWRANVSAVDLRNETEKAERYAATMPGGRVFVYPKSEKDPLEAARRDVLLPQKGASSAKEYEAVSTSGKVLGGPYKFHGEAKAVADKSGGYVRWAGEGAGERSKKVPLGFQVVETRTNVAMSEVFARREPARAVAAALTAQGHNVGVLKLEAYVSPSWKRGIDPDPVPDNAPRPAANEKVADKSGGYVRWAGEGVGEPGMNAAERLTSDVTINGYQQLTKREYARHLELLRKFAAAEARGKPEQTLWLSTASEEDQRLYAAMSQSGLFVQGQPVRSGGPFTWDTIRLSDYGRVYLGQRSGGARASSAKEYEAVSTSGKVLGGPYKHMDEAKKVADKSGGYVRWAGEGVGEPRKESWRKTSDFPPTYVTMSGHFKILGDNQGKRWVLWRLVRSGPEDIGAYSSLVEAQRAAEGRWGVAEEKLTNAERNALPASSFALPARRELPLEDASHVRNAAARLSMMKNEGHVTPAEYRSAHAKIKAARRRFGVEVREGPDCRHSHPPEVPVTPCAAEGTEDFAVMERDQAAVAAGQRLPPLDTPKAVYDFCAESLLKQTSECFVVIPLDVHGRPLNPKPYLVAMGQRDRVAVEIEQIHAPVVATNAAAFLVGHQHPGNSRGPSKADRDLHKKVATATKTSYPSVVYLDSVIVTRGAIYSSVDDKTHRV